MKGCRSTWSALRGLVIARHICPRCGEVDERGTHCVLCCAEPEYHGERADYWEDQRMSQSVEKDVICPCGHSITRHSPEWGCDAYVPPKIGGSGACCTRSPAAVVASVIPPGTQP